MCKPRNPHQTWIQCDMFPYVSTIPKPTQHAFYMTTTTINWPSKETTTWLNSGQLTLILSLLHSWFWMGFCALRGNRVAPNRYLPGYWGSKWSSVAISRGRGQGTLVFFGPLFLTGTMKGIKATRTSLTEGRPQKFTHHLYIYIYIYIDMTWETYWGMYRKGNKHAKIDIQNMFV